MSKAAKRDIDKELWELYDKADTMVADKFNQKYKVIEQLVILAKYRLDKQGDETPEFFKPEEEKR